MKNLNGIFLFAALLIFAFVFVSILGNFVSISPSYAPAKEQSKRVDSPPRTAVEAHSDELNISSPSPPFSVQEEASTNQGAINSLNNSTNTTTQEILAIQERDDFEIDQGGSKVVTDLEKIEARLQKSRAAIKKAYYGNQANQDPDYVPIGPMYRNAKSFHRSYLEMEKNLKVYVYEEGEPPIFHEGPCRNLYSTEGTFIYEIEKNNQFRTKDPSKAQLYFLPFSVTRLVQYVYNTDSRYDFSPIERTVIDYVDLISRRYPFWNRSLGADHFMAACHDWGPKTSFSIPYLHKNSIRALCNANTSEKFNPGKDVSIPEIKLISYQTTGTIGGPSPSKRPVLAFFAGGNHGPVRPIVFKHWENSNDTDIRVHSYLPKGVSYYKLIRQSKYCLCPSGYEVASPRIVESIYTGCVPVLISDNFVPPFSDVLNWKSFSVEVPVSEVPNLKRILSSISTRRYLRMQRRVLQIRRHFEFNSPPKRFDVFHMILHSVWLRRLNIRVLENQTER
jgi:hypothetical protein